MTKRSENLFELYFSNLRKIESPKKNLANVRLGEGGLKTSQRRLGEVFRVTSFCFPRRVQDVVENEKMLRFIMTKTGNCFVISLGFGYVLHHCNAKKLPMEVTKCVCLKGERN